MFLKPVYLPNFLSDKTIVAILLYRTNLTESLGGESLSLHQLRKELARPLRRIASRFSGKFQAVLNSVRPEAGFSLRMQKFVIITLQAEV